MRILVCGDRHWKDRAKIYQRLAAFTWEEDVLIIEGECQGADILAREVAEELKLKVEKHPALWKKFGNSAGPKRNREMLDRKPDLVIAFHPDFSRSRGTVDTVGEAYRRGIPVEVIK